MNTIRIGVVGYCPPTRFDTDKALQLIRKAYDQVKEIYPDQSITIVSGLTDVGVIGIAYREAVQRNWRTAGIACRQALNHALFPVDEQQIVGEKWGDESATFLANLDLLVRVGGGAQSHAETAAIKMSGRPVIEYELAAL